MGTGGIGYRVPSDSSNMPELAGLGGNNISGEYLTLGNVLEASIVTNQTAFLLQAAENQDGWDRGRKFET